MLVYSSNRWWSHHFKCSSVVSLNLAHPTHLFKCPLESFFRYAIKVHKSASRNSKLLHKVTKAEQAKAWKTICFPAHNSIATQLAAKNQLVNLSTLKVEYYVFPEFLRFQIVLNCDRPSLQLSSCLFKKCVTHEAMNKSLEREFLPGTAVIIIIVFQFSFSV